VDLAHGAGRAEDGIVKLLKPEPEQLPPNGPYDSLFQGGGASCSATAGTAPMFSLLLLVMTLVGARKR
jgi:uncharacterized protein (TIGR03382 family)